MMPVDGVTLVTGATKGIGRAISTQLAARGEAVIGIARHPDSSYPGTLILADLGDRAARMQALAHAVSQFRILRLVNNAGVNHMQAFGEVTPDAASEILDINLGVTVDASQAVLAPMRAAGFGRIVNIASRSLLGRPGGGMYAAAKAALVGLTRSWALEVAGQGITVNCVAPGPIETEMFARNNPSGLPRTRALVSSVPMSRMGTPQEVANAIAYFLAPEAGFTTGQTLFVCGGASISQGHF